VQAVLAGHVKGELIAFGISVNQVSTDLSRCLGMAQTAALLCPSAPRAGYRPRGQEPLDQQIVL